MKKFPWLFSFILIASFCSANTYSEPWHEEVLKQAESFVLLKIKSIDQIKGIKATLIKTIAGKDVPKDITIDKFFMLDITSTSGQRFVFELPQMETAYFFLKKGEGENYEMPTPTSGFAMKRKDNVFATYRISMHKTLVPVDIYEKTMSELFKLNHNQLIDKDYFSRLYQEYLNQKPGRLDSDVESERNIFFMQHVALESMYYINDKTNYDLIIPFLNSDQFHNQISGVRALSSIDTKGSKDQLIQFIADKKYYPFAQVMAVWALRRLNASEYTDKLKEISKIASTDDVDYGIGIMDPRVGTFIDRNVKVAIDNLLADWKKTSR